MRSKFFVFIIIIGTIFLIAGVAGISANFSASLTTGTVPLTVKFTDKSTGSPTGWAWFFGDENYTAPWTEVNASAGWSGRYDHSTVVLHDGSIVLMGGLGPGFKNDVWRSTDKGATWKPVNASAGWSARYGHSSVVLPDGSIVLMGGHDGNLKNDVWRSTDKGATWTQMTSHAGWTARDLTSSVVLPDGSIVLMGGYDGSYWHDVWRSTDKGATWILVNASAGWSARYYPSSVVLPDGSIILMGGGANGDLLNDVWRFMPAGSLAQNPSHAYTRPGTYQVALQTYNAGGYNSIRKPGYIKIKSLPRPMVTVIKPNSGIWGTTVQITDLIGTGFATGAKVYLTKTGYSPLNATNISVISPTNITCTFKIPLYTAIGFWNVQVNNTDGQSGTKVNAFMVKTPSPPTVTGITPASGIRGTTVQITYLAGTGFGLNPKPIVQLVKNTNTIKATNITVINPNRMTCTFTISPYAITGPWNVKVTNADMQYGVKIGAFTVDT